MRFGGPLGQPAERRDLVDLLERLAPEQGALDLADRHEHRGRVLARGVDADGEVRATDRARPERDRRASGQLAVRFGHERGRAFVTRRDDPDPGALEGIEQAQERLAGHGEGVSDARGTEDVGDVAADRPGTFGHRRFEVGFRCRFGGGRVLGVGCRFGVGCCFGIGGRFVGWRLIGALGLGDRHHLGRLRRRLRSVLFGRRRLGSERCGLGCRFEVGNGLDVGRLLRRHDRRGRLGVGRDWGGGGLVVRRGRGVELGHGDSAPSVGLAPFGGWSAVVLELERDSQIELAQAAHDALEVIPALAGDTNGVTLDL